MEEFVDYIMHTPFCDALPGGSYYNPAVGSLKLHTRSVPQNDRLFADDIWPGAVLLADYMCSRPDVVKKKRILELGAGAALPSLVSCRLGARFVVITDFHDSDILGNINDLLIENSIPAGNVCVKGFNWGEDPAPLLVANASEGNEAVFVSTERFQVIIMAELLWRETYCQHKKLLTSASFCLADDGIILVSFAKRCALTQETSSSGSALTISPKEELDDDDFFEIAKSMGFVKTIIQTKKMRDVCCVDMVDVGITVLTKSLKPLDELYLLDPL